MLKFKPGFSFGVATAASQIEGGNHASNWSRFCDQGLTKDGSKIQNATQHYRLYREDTELLARMGIKEYRMSLEWARINPQPGYFDSEVFARYRAELLLLREYGIRPLLTFYHFVHPLWFEDLGGFTRPENNHYFLEYLEKCLEVIGDLVDDYVTINEPNVYAVLSYLFAEWPPARNKLGLTLKVMNNLIFCHLSAYQTIHRVLPREVRVGFAHHARVFVPLRKNNLLHKWSAKIFKYAFQSALNKAMLLGKFSFPFKNIGNFNPGKYSDFIGINYYTRSAVGFFKETTLPDVATNDLGWEIYPPGIVEVAQESYNLLPVPIYITENGTCDNSDRFRRRYLCEHLQVVVQSALPIERYYHWCFVDNFEWKEGEVARFGLVHNDFITQQRTIKKSGYFYQKIIRDHAIDKDTFAEIMQTESYN